jgi:hypothetical protein
MLGSKIASEASLSEIEASSRLISDRGKLHPSSLTVRLDEQGDDMGGSTRFATWAIR